MKFYDLAGSPNTRRVRIFMAEKGLDIPVTVVDMMKKENTSPEFLAKNSLGALPVLELDDGSYLSESMAICRYLEELYPEPPLFGTSPKDKALVEMWNRRIELEILYPVLYAFTHSHEMWKGRRAQIPEWADLSRQKAAKMFDWLEGEIEGRDYIANDCYTVADITAQCCVLMAKAALGIRLKDEHKNLNAWWERVTARPTARA